MVETLLSNDGLTQLAFSIYENKKVFALLLGSGVTAWLNLRSYPAVLVFTAYGLGLARSEQWDLLFGLFSAELSHPYREPQKFVEIIFLSAWDGSENRMWQQLPGFERRKTAFSDHLMDVFGSWSDSFVGLTPDFQTFYERFELLGSLAFLTSTQPKDFKAPQQDFVWMPIGRSGWNSRGFEKVTKELQAPKLSTPLLKAGFAHGSEAFLTEFVSNAGKLAGRMRWM
jgi:hypothetical protein